MRKVLTGLICGLSIWTNGVVADPVTVAKGLYSAWSEYEEGRATEARHAEVIEKLDQVRDEIINFIRKERNTELESKVRVFYRDFMAHRHSWYKDHTWARQRVSAGREVHDLLVHYIMTDSDSLKNLIMPLNLLTPALAIMAKAVDDAPQNITELFEMTVRANEYALDAAEIEWIMDYRYGFYEPRHSGRLFMDSLKDIVSPWKYGTTKIVIEGVTVPALSEVSPPVSCYDHQDSTVFYWESNRHLPQYRDYAAWKATKRGLYAQIASIHSDLEKIASRHGVSLNPWRYQREFPHLTNLNQVEKPKGVSITCGIDGP